MLFATQYTEMLNECRELSQEELDLNVNSVYNVIHGDYDMTVEIYTWYMYVYSFTKLIHVSFYVS